MSIAQCSRQMSSSPDVRIVKSDRALGVLEEKKFVKEGAEFREHSLRRCVQQLCRAVALPPPRPRPQHARLLGGVRLASRRTVKGSRASRLRRRRARVALTSALR